VTSWDTVSEERKSLHHFRMFVFLDVFVCKPDISATSKSEPIYSVLAIVSSEHTQQRI